MEAWREGWTLELDRLFDCGRNASRICIHKRLGRKSCAHPVRLEVGGRKPGIHLVRIEARGVNA